jgi:glutamyl-tRNA reductase
MHIIILGVDHTTASIALRERLACSSRQIPHVLSATQQSVQESVLLSTCNRVELYAVCADAIAGRSECLRILSNERQIDQAEVEAHSYCYVDEQAVTHLFGVACGLCSLVPGEPQIQGQVADAMEIAQGGGYAGPVLSALFRAALVAGKRARHETGISRNAASVSHVAVQLARHLFPDFQQANVLLIGSGQMSELAARNLRDNGAQRLVIVNRTHEHAIQLAQSLGAVHRPFPELADALVEADIVISSTRAPRAIISLELMQRVMEQRGGRSLLLIDTALPRDVDPAVTMVPGVHLYNLDDLQAEVNRGIQLRLQETEHVQRIIAEEVQNFTRWLSSLSVAGTISDLRQHAEMLRKQEFERGMRYLASTLSEREAAAVQELTTRFMNKLLHTPMLRLKDAAAAGRGHVYAEALRYLFALEEDDETNYDRDAGKQASNDTDAMGLSATTSAMAQP